MRTDALKKGYSLSEYGLNKGVANKDNLKPPYTDFLCPTEKDVFEALKVPYKEPHERDL
jgi:DNA polymerase/3'-5' exonuclease PolX